MEQIKSAADSDSEGPVCTFLNLSNEEIIFIISVSLLPNHFLLCSLLNGLFQMYSRISD